MTPPPMNAPEAGSNGEREALAKLIDDNRWAPLEGGVVRRTPSRELADAILAAGFTRAHHDGERVAAGCRDTVECYICGGSGGEQVGPISDEYDGDAQTRACFACHGHGRLDLDAVRKLCDDEAVDHDITKGALLATIAERDALAAKLAIGHREGFVFDRQRLGAEVQRDAAIARAEAAEAKLAEAERECVEAHRGHGVTLRQAADVDRGWVEATKRAAALAEVVSEEAMRLHAGAMVGPTADLADLCDSVSVKLRAALAGNGNGTGEGA